MVYLEIEKNIHMLQECLSASRWKTSQLTLY